MITVLPYIQYECKPWAEFQYSTDKERTKIIKTKMGMGRQLNNHKIMRTILLVISYY